MSEGLKATTTAVRLVHVAQEHFLGKLRGTGDARALSHYECPATPHRRRTSSSACSRGHRGTRGLPSPHGFPGRHPIYAIGGSELGLGKTLGGARRAAAWLARQRGPRGAASLVKARRARTARGTRVSPGSWRARGTEPRLPRRPSLLPVGQRTASQHASRSREVGGAFGAWLCRATTELCLGGDADNSWDRLLDAKRSLTARPSPAAGGDGSKGAGLVCGACTRVVPDS